MLSAEQIRLDIAQKRVAYGWKIFQNHGIVDVDAEVPILEPNGVPLEDIAAELFPDRKPEAFDIREAVQVDLAAFEEILAGEYDPQIKERNPRGRDPTINTEDGLVNCLHLAFAGILTSSVSQASRDMYVKGLKKSYDGVEVGNLLGIGIRSFRESVDKKQRIVFDKYPITTSPSGNYTYVDKETLLKMLKVISTSVLFAEVADHLTNVYGLRPQTAGHLVPRFARKPKDFVALEDPYSGHRIYHHKLLGLYNAMSLNSLNTLMNVVRRDKRILDTHIKTAEVGRKLRTTPNRLLENGDLPGREVHTLRPRSGLQFYVCDDDIEEYHRIVKERKLSRERYLNLAQLCDRLERVGVLYEPNNIPSWIREEAMKLNPNGIYCISVEQVGSVIGRMKKEERHSQDYRTYCRIKNLKLNEGHGSFERDFDEFSKSKRIAASVRRNFDFTYNGIHIRNLDPRDHDVDAIVAEIVEKNRKAMEELRGEIAKAGLDVEESYTDATTLYIPIKNGGKLGTLFPTCKNTDLFQLKNRLIEREIAKRVFGYHEFVSLPDLLEIAKRVKNFDEIMESTKAVDEVSSATGLGIKYIKLLAVDGFLPSLTVGIPYSNEIRRRYTNADVEVIQGRNRLVSLVDIHRMALREKVLIGFKPFYMQFQGFKERYSPDELEYERTQTSYSYAYAQAFLTYMKRKAGIESKVDEMEQARFVLPRDLVRAEKMNVDTLLSIPISETSHGTLHSLALYCKVNEDQVGLKAKVVKHMTERFNTAVLGEDRENDLNLNELAMSTIWGAFLSYDLYSGTPFLEHFNGHVKTFMDPYLILEKPIEEMDEVDFYTLALGCKRGNSNGLAEKLGRHFEDLFVDTALGRTRAKAVELRGYAAREVWEVFRTYDLDSGTLFMDHFRTYIGRSFAPDERRGYERHLRGDKLFSDPATKTDGDDRMFGDTIEYEGPDSETQLELAEQRHALYQSLGSLDETQRAVLLGFYFEDRSVLELAQQLGKDEAAVNSMLEEGIDHMRELMQ
jgi:RNA polymerase sigma factor (sigma-70 family)